MTIGPNVRRIRRSKGMFSVTFASCPETSQLRVRVEQKGQLKNKIDLKIKARPTSFSVTLYVTGLDGIKIAQMRFRIFFKLRNGFVAQRQCVNLRTRTKTSCFKLPRRHQLTYQRNVNVM